VSDVKHAAPTTGEFHLRLERTISPSTRRPCTLLVLTTVKAFTNFRYGLTVEESREGNLLRLTVLGLDAPDLNLPGSGPAEFRREYEDLTGDCTVELTTLDGKSATARFAISNDRVALLEPVRGAGVAVDLFPPSNTQSTARS
jgi:hypothetical protein